MKKTKENTLDLEFLKNWIILILDHLAKQDTQKALFANLTDSVLKEYAKENSKGLRTLYRQIFSMAVTSSEEIQESLNEKLSERFGKRLNDIVPDQPKKITLSEKGKKELEFMKDWCLSILDFINGKMDRTFGSPDINSMKETLIKNYEQPHAESVAGFKEAYRDLNNWAMGLPHKDIIELNSILMKKFGHSLGNVEKATNLQIKKIAKRGIVNSADEYRLLEDRINELVRISPESSEIEIINSLLRNYQASDKQG